MKISSFGAGATLALVLSLTGAQSVALAACDGPTRSLQYLSAKQHADGSLDGAVGETLDFVLGAAALGYDPATLLSSGGKTPFDWLGSNLASATADPNRTGKLIQAVVAGRLNPRSFSGTDLLQALQAFYQSGSGAFIKTPGDVNDPCQASANAAYCQANSILGLRVAADASYPVPAQAITYLKGLQQGDGAWQLFGSDDTNATAMALMALAAVSDASADANAFTFLHTQQDAASGGFVESTSYQSNSDPDSDALVIQGLLAAGQDPGSAAWSNPKGSAASDLPSFQDAASGGYFFDKSSPSPSAFTTSEVSGGLARQPFPIHPAYSSRRALPATGCPSASVSGASPSPAPLKLPPAGVPPAGESLPVGWVAMLLVGLAACAGARLALRR